MYLITGYLIWSLLLSTLTFAMYGWDKRQARHDQRRTPEATLQGLAWAGGWPGALVGQRVFRHKTRKFGFNVILWLAVAVHLVGLIAIGWIWLTW